MPDTKNSKRIIDNEANARFQNQWGSGYISPTKLIPFPEYISPLDMIKYGEDYEYESNEGDWGYSALDFCCEYADYDNGDRPGYWAEDIVMEAMPSAYEADNHSNEEEGYWAEDIVIEAMPSAYGEADNHPNDSNEEEGYWAEDIIREAMPSAYGDNASYYQNETINGGDEGDEEGGYFAMDILAAQMPGLYADHGESGWFNLGIYQSL